MAVIRKISPVGIDRNVDEVQTLLEELNWVDFNIYHRIYKENISGGVKPMRYTSDGDYEDVFMNDTINGNCFFYDTGSINETNGMFQDVELSIIFQINLDNLFSSIAHRADEEAHNEVILKLRELPPTYKIKGVVKEIKKVYAEFDTTRVLLDDVGKFHVFRVDLTCLVDYACCSNC